MSGGELERTLAAEIRGGLLASPAGEDGRERCCGTWQLAATREEWACREDDRSQEFGDWLAGENRHQL